MLMFGLSKSAGDSFSTSSSDSRNGSEEDVFTPSCFPHPETMKRARINKKILMDKSEFWL